MPPIDDISKEALYEEVKGLYEENAELKYQLAEARRLMFGQKRERFVPALPPEQGNLFNPLADVVAVNPTVNPAPHSERKGKGQIAGKANPNHKGRNEFPSHLPRIVEILTPQIVETHPDCFTQMGQEITETLDYTPAKLVVIQRQRGKYVVQPNSNISTDISTDFSQNMVRTLHQAKSMTEGVLIAPLPDRPLPKAIAEAGLLAQICVDKFVDHLPIDRQSKRFKRENGIDIKGSTIVGWLDGVCTLLEPLYAKLEDLVFDTHYLQADESTLKCLENAPKGKTHTSYQWVYRNVEKGLILFDYQRHRSGACLHPRVKTHKGYLQTDGYQVYDALEGLPDLVLLNCFAHARREFFEAKLNDPQRAEKALDFIGQIYQFEKNIREQNLNTDQTLAYRIEKINPVLVKMKTWLDEQIDQVLPQSRIGKAIAYTLNRWTKLSRFTTEGYLEIDNNRIENAIRPLALGRKNFLFAGSDEGGKRAAMMYAFFATCHAHNINPLEWLTDVLKRINAHPIKQIEELLPHRWVK